MYNHDEEKEKKEKDSKVNMDTFWQSDIEYKMS